MLTAVDILLDELSFMFNQINKPGDIINRAPLIYKFTNIFLTNPLLEPIRACLDNDCQRDNASIIPALKDATSKRWPLYDAIAEFIEHKKVFLPPSMYNPSIFKNRTDMTLVCFDAQDNMFRNVISCFLESPDEEILEFLKKHAHIEYDNNNKRFAKFPIDKKHLENERNHFDRILLTREWYKFCILVDFYIIYDKKVFVEKIDALQKSGLFVFSNILINNSRALDQAMDPRIDPSQREKIFNINIYLDPMESLLNYVKSRKSLLSTTNGNDKKDSKSEKCNIAKQKQRSIDLDEESRCLVVDDNQLTPLTEDKGPFLLSKAFFPNHRYRKNGLSSVTAYNIVKKPIPKVRKLDESQAKEVYGWCDGINENLYNNECPRGVKMNGTGKIVLRACYKK